MKMFQHIKLYGSSAQISALHEKLAEWTPTTTWRRDEELIRQRSGSSPDAVVFEYSGPAAPGAFVWLFDEPYGARVTNIVPRTAGSLSYGEYNTIAESFVHDVLEPLAAHVAIRVDVGRAEASIDDLLPPSVARALRRFSDSANRATGAAHPQDAEKWDQFVILAYRNREQASIAPSTLRRWLVEDERWPDEQAYELSLEYETGLRLLESNDKFKAA